MIEHFWEKIDGEFTFPDLYGQVARWAGQRSWHGVEVGVKNGQSAAFLAVELLNRATMLDVQLDLVDISLDKDLVAATLGHVAHAIGKLHRLPSVEAAKLYADNSLDFVMIDADHEYRSVADDISAWLPKVAPGAALAGHDFTSDFPGVIRAVLERFGRFEIWRGIPYKNGQYFPSWVVRL